MINKLITLLLFGVWFKLFNVFFYSYFDIPIEFVIGEGMNWFKVYWLFFFITSTTLAFKLMRFIFNLKDQRVEHPDI